MSEIQTVGDMVDYLTEKFDRDMPIRKVDMNRPAEIRTVLRMEFGDDTPTYAAIL